MAKRRFGYAASKAIRGKWFDVLPGQPKRRKK
jgi:hypothetical protein